MLNSNFYKIFACIDLLGRKIAADTSETNFRVLFKNPQYPQIFIT